MQNLVLAMNIQTKQFGIYKIFDNLKVAKASYTILHMAAIND